MDQIANKIIKHSDIETLRSNPELRHFGILGMKWGVRRTPEQLGRKPVKKSNRKERKRQERSQIAQEKFNKETNDGLEKGIKTRKNDPTIISLDKAGRIGNPFYDFSTKDSKLPSMKEIDSALNKEYKDMESRMEWSEGLPSFNGNWAKNDSICYLKYDNLIEFGSKSDVLGGHTLDVEFTTTSDGTVKILGVAMNG